MELSLRINVGTILAIVAAEVVSFVWYADNMPWHRYAADRYFITAIISDIGLVMLLQYVTGKFYDCDNLEDMVWFGLFVVALQACLEAPFQVHNNSRMNSRFVCHLLHRFAVVVVVLFVLHYAKRNL